MSKKVWAVVPAAGVGARMAADRPKQYLELAGQTVLARTLETLLGHDKIAGVVVVVSANDAYWPSLNAELRQRVRIADGGAERCHSVLAGLQVLTESGAAQDWALVHDAARPCLSQDDIQHMLDELMEHPVGGILAAPVRDTLKRCGADGTIEQTVDRARLWHALTPQMFRIDKLSMAIEQALAAGIIVTDEAQAIEHSGAVPKVVEGQASNLKITHPADLAMAELILRSQGRI